MQGYFKELDGEFYDSEEIKNMLYAKTGIFENYKNIGGFIFRNPITLSKMKKEEASEFINKIINYIDNDTDCILTPELRNCWLLHVKDSDIEFAIQFNFPEKTPEYIRHQHSLTCINCGIFNINGNDSHHIRHNTGLANKPPDWFSIPLCRNCHNKLQALSGHELAKILPIYGFNIEIYCKLAYLRWLNKL